MKNIKTQINIASQDQPDQVVALPAGIFVNKDRNNSSYEGP